MRLMMVNLCDFLNIYSIIFFNNQPKPNSQFKQNKQNASLWLNLNKKHTNIHGK